MNSHDPQEVSCATAQQGAGDRCEMVLITRPYGRLVASVTEVMEGLMALEARRVSSSSRISVRTSCIGRTRATCIIGASAAHRLATNVAVGDFALILMGTLKGAAIRRCRQRDGRAAILGRCDQRDVLCSPQPSLHLRIPHYLASPATRFVRNRRVQTRSAYDLPG